VLWHFLFTWIWQPWSALGFAVFTPILRDPALTSGWMILGQIAFFFNYYYYTVVLLVLVMLVYKH